MTRCKYVDDLMKNKKIGGGRFILPLISPSDRWFLDIVSCFCFDLFSKNISIIPRKWCSMLRMERPPPSFLPFPVLVTSSLMTDDKHIQE